MAVASWISEQEYRDLARNEHSRLWELWDGVPREKPLPQVVEVWSRTTAAYDYAVKLQAYRDRGDQEIWYIHPYERTLTAWRRQPDGSYNEEVYRGGIVPVTFLPGVTIDFDNLPDG